MGSKRIENGLLVKGRGGWLAGSSAHLVILGSKVSLFK